MIGIRRDRWGFRAYVKVRSTQRERRFPPDTPLETMKAWRDDTRAQLRKVAPIRTRGTIRVDARTYLALVRHLASYQSRVCEIDAWVELYGDRPRATLMRADVLTARATWSSQDYAPKTINHRVRALKHLYRLLDGPHAPTPCDGIQKLPEPDPSPQFVSVTTIRKVANHLRDPQARARFMVLTSTGMRPSQVKRAEPTDVNLHRRIWYVRSGKGGNPIPLHLTDDMLAAWRAFIAADAWGPFDVSAYDKRLYVAGWPRHVRPYNAKHTVAITLIERGASWEDLKDFLGHKDVKTSRIYTGVIASRLRKTSELLAGRIGWTTDQPQRKSGPTSRGTLSGGRAPSPLTALAHKSGIRAERKTPRERVS